MALYFFDFHEAGRVLADDVGSEFDTLDQARDAARRTLAQLAKEAAVPFEVVIEIREQQSDPVSRLSLQIRELGASGR